MKSQNKKLTIFFMYDDIKQAIINKERFIYKYVSVDFLERKVPKLNTGLKICVLLSGGLRNFEYTCDWINKFLIEPLDADVFIHGWANSNGVEDNISKINKFSNLKKHVINDINDPNFEFLKKSNPLVTRLFGQFFNIKACNELRKSHEQENTKYDLVIRARPDVFFFNELDISDIKYTYDNQVIAIPVEYFKLWSNKITDVFAMAKSDIMDKYCNAYETVLESNYVVGEAESVVDYHVKNKVRVSVHNIIPNFIIDYPIDLITDNMSFSPKIDNLSPSVTNRLLFQNDIK